MRGQSGRVHDIPQGAAWDDAVEWIASHQNELIPPVRETDRRGPRIDDPTALHNVSLQRSLSCFDHDLILPLQPPQETKMGVAMTGQDRRAWRAGKRARLRIAGTEGQCAAIGAVQDNQIDVHGRHRQLGDRVCVGPRPGFRGLLAGQRARPGSLQQILCEPGLRIHPRSFPDLPQADGEEAYRQDEENG